QASYASISGLKTYDGGANFLSSEVTLTGVNGETFTVAGTSNSANASLNPSNPSTSFISTTGPITGVSGSDPNNYSALVVTTLTGTNNVATIGQASYASISGLKTYDGGANFLSSEVTLTGVNGETFTVAGTSNSANASLNPSNPSTSFISTTGPITGVSGSDPNNYTALVVTTLTGTNNVATIGQASYA